MEIKQGLSGGSEMFRHTVAIKHGIIVIWVLAVFLPGEIPFGRLSMFAAWADVVVDVVPREIEGVDQVSTERLRQILLPFSGAGGFSQARALAVKKDIKAEDLNLLRQALSNRSIVNAWGNIAKALAILDSSSDTLDYLVAYIRRPEDWQGARVSMVGQKLNPLSALGLMENAKALDTLRKTLTPEGGRDIVSAWIDDPNLPTYWAQKRPVIVVVAQMRAADGLVYANDAEGIRTIEEMYRQLDTELRGNPEYELSLTLPPDREAKRALYTGLISALAVRDMIAEMGLPAYLEFESAPDFFEKYGPYGRKYDGLLPMSQALQGKK